MARSGYGSGRRQVQVWVSLALHGQMKAVAAAGGLSLQEWMAEAFREKVSRDGAGASGAGLAVPAQADERGFGPAGGRGGGDPVGVVAADARVGPDWDALLAQGRENRLSVMGRTSLYDTEHDPLEEIA